MREMGNYCIHLYYHRWTYRSVLLTISEDIKMQRVAVTLNAYPFLCLRYDPSFL